MAMPHRSAVRRSCTAPPVGEAICNHVHRPVAPESMASADGDPGGTTRPALGSKARATAWPAAPILLPDRHVVASRSGSTADSPRSWLDLIRGRQCFLQVADGYGCADRRWLPLTP